MQSSDSTNSISYLEQQPTVIGQIDYLSNEQNYGLMTIFDTAGQPLAYPDGEIANDILFELPRNEPTPNLGDWALIQNYQPLNDQSFSPPRPVKLNAIVNSFLEEKFVNVVMTMAKNKLSKAFDERHHALKTLENELVQNQGVLQKGQDDLSEREKWLEVEETRLKGWNDDLEKSKIDLDTQRQKLASTQEAQQQRFLQIQGFDWQLTQRLEQYGLAENQINDGDIILSEELIEILWEQELIKERLRREKLPELVQRDFDARQEIIQQEEQKVNDALTRWGFNPLSESVESKKKPSLSAYSTEEGLLHRVDDYIHGKGFDFSWNALVNFYTSLKTGELTILAGLSGTGKSSLIRLFAEAINAQFTLVPVKATWSDDADLMGFYHPVEKTYIPTPFLDAIVEAIAHPNELHFICLDEMNLSRVEYYFANLLSVLEQGEQRCLDLYSKYEWELRYAKLERMRRNLSLGEMSEVEFSFHEKNVHSYRHEIPIPRNIFICGTVNIDETTKPFSDKVLDRAQIIQFEQVTFQKQVVKPSSPTRLTFDQFNAFKQKAKTSLDDDWFNTLNRCLKIGGFHFGHRVKRHIEDYCAYAMHSQLFDALSEGEIIDLQIIQKILPKIRGFRTDNIQDEMFPQLKDLCSGKQAKQKIASMAEMESINYWQV